jgi:HPt (histidine-containing phosphotransfer) domain-containing protein
VALTADVFFESQPERGAAFDSVLYKPIDETRLYGILSAMPAFDEDGARRAAAEDAPERQADLPEALQSRLDREIREGLGKVREQLRSGSRGQLADSLHHLKGVAGYFGIEALDAALRDMEANLADLDDAAVSARLDRIEALARSCSKGLNGRTTGPDSKRAR